jgi:hypothetical protein
LVDLAELTAVARGTLRSSHRVPPPAAVVIASACLTCVALRRRGRPDARAVYNKFMTSRPLVLLHNCHSTVQISPYRITRINGSRHSWWTSVDR